MSMRTMTVGDLIALLEDAAEEHGKDMPVIFSSDYGDYTHTEQAHKIKGEAEVVVLSKSGYSTSGYAVADSDDDDEYDETETGDKYSKPYEPFLRIK